MQVTWAVMKSEYEWSIISLAVRLGHKCKHGQSVCPSGVFFARVRDRTVTPRYFGMWTTGLGDEDEEERAGDGGFCTKIYIFIYTGDSYSNPNTCALKINKQIKQS